MGKNVTFTLSTNIDEAICYAVTDAACFDARGNGDGGVAPTITGDHENRITDYTAVLVYNDRRRADYHIADDNLSPTVCAKYGTGGVIRR